MELTLIPVKQVFYNEDNGYRVLSCIPEKFNTQVELNKYGNFTLSGYNLTNILLHQAITLDITLDKDSKYPASYTVDGYSGISFNQTIKVEPSHELLLLEQIMSKDQAFNINKVYPNFIELVLNNKESEIDTNKIYNVGQYRLQDYCDKIRKNFNVFLFFSRTKNYNINDFALVTKFSLSYPNIDMWEEEYKKAPYSMLSHYTNWSFKKIDKTVLSALPENLNSAERATFCVYDYLKQNEAEGDTRIKAQVLKNIIKDEYPELDHFVVDIIKTDNQIYFDTISKFCGLKITYKAEQNIAKNILDRITHPQKDTMDFNNFKTLNNFTMTDEQLEICRIANDQSIGMLIGAAGSGKTSATKALIQMLEHYNKSYLLLAPTGISAKRLRESTGREAYTIHMALARNIIDSEKYDYIIIDEMSCVGVHLLSNVFELTSIDTKFIFICDNAQLASISCGNIVEDIINSNLMPTAQLTKIFRYGTSGIATIATNTRNGIINGRNNSENHFADDDYTFIDIDDSKAIEQIVDKHSELLASGYSINDILILCPFNKSSIGTFTINQAIQKYFNNKSVPEITIDVNNQTIKKIKFKLNDRVINTHNNYHATKLDIDNDNNYIPNGECAVMNGDIGTVRNIVIDNENNNSYMDIEFEENYVRFSSKECKDLLLGYAISCHKVQGAQAKVIISVMSKQHKRMITRNLLYVAVSRAEEKLIEIGDKESIKQGLEMVETIDRSTWLKDLLLAN